MGLRTDLAMEAIEAFVGDLPKGVERQEEEKNGLKITRIQIDAEVTEQIGKREGRYITVEVNSFDHIAQNFSNELTVLADEIRAMLPAEGDILVAGLGNQNITPDALGPKTVDGILVTRHIPQEIAEQTGLGGLRSTSAIAPGVLGQTGMETFEILSSLVDKLQPSVLIVVDALASKSIDRLGKTVQISDTGISPGSGVQNSRKELSLSSIGIPVIAIGVPTVVDMSTIAEELTDENANVSERGVTMMVTPREIDMVIEKSARVLSLAINRALQPQLQIEDIIALVS